LSDLTPFDFSGSQPVSAFRPWFASALEEVVGVDTTRCATSEAYADGFSAGRLAAELESAAERRELEKLVAASACFQPETSDGLAKMIAIAVEEIVRTTVGEAAIDRDVLIARIERAAKIIGESENNRVLFLHPDDFRLLAQAKLPLPVEKDPNLLRGSIRIEHPSGSVEDGIATLLHALREQLGVEGFGK